MELDHDWEFYEDGVTIVPISVAVVAEDGRTYHAVFDSFPIREVRLHPFLGKYVWTKLPLITLPDGDTRLDLDHPDVKPAEVIRADLLRFIMATPKPSLWGLFPSYDHVALAQRWGRMVDLPSCVPMRTNDVAQEWERLGYPRIPEQPRESEHHPLADARWSQFLRRYLRAHEVIMRGFGDLPRSLGGLDGAGYPVTPTAEELLR